MEYRRCQWRRLARLAVSHACHKSSRGQESHPVFRTQVGIHLLQRLSHCADSDPLQRATRASQSEPQSVDTTICEHVNRNQLRGE
jgi:hypothetical protein